MKNSFKILASNTVAEKRISICKKCPNYNYKICKICKCFMPLKVKLFSAQCPMNKWQEKFYSEEWC